MSIEVCLQPLTTVGVSHHRDDWEVFVFPLRAQQVSLLSKLLEGHAYLRFPLFQLSLLELQQRLAWGGRRPMINNHY